MPAFDPSRVKEIFAQVQHSVTSHKNLQNELKTLHNSLPEKVFFKIFTDCLRVPLMCGEKTAPTERTLNFAVSFITSFISKKARPEGKGTNDEENAEEDEMPKFVLDMFKFMCENAGTENQTIRFRICQFINKLLNGLGNEACMDDELCDLLCDRLLERLRDKSPLVRTQAVRALYRLQDPMDVNCRVTSAFMFHITSDPSHDVRSTVLTNIAVSSHSVRVIVERTRDTYDTVRKVAFLRIAELNIQRFSIDQRVRLLERGLKDQSEKVRKCVTSDLLRSWFEFHKGSFISFLHSLDCEHSTEISTLALETMFKSIKTGLTTAIEQIQALQGSDKLIPVDELTSENALLWQVVSAYLENHPEIAEERPIDEPLEDLVPELSTFCSYILKYFDQPVTDKDPYAHTLREYILGRLLAMCDYFDLSDEMGRANLRTMCQTLLLNNNVSNRVVPLLVKIIVKVIPDLDDRLQCLAEVIAELHDPSSDQDETPLPPVVEMSAEEKRQLNIKEAKIRMKLNELTEDQDEAVKSKDFIRAQQLQDECQTLRDELKALTTPPPPVEKPATQEVRTEDVIIKDKKKLQKCLCIVKEMMQPSSVVSLTPTLRSLMHNFVMPCLQQQAEDPVIKNMALEAMGLFCLLDRDLAKQHFVYLFCFQIAIDEVCETALKVTFDLLHLYGLETFHVEESRTDDSKKRRSKRKKNLFVTDIQDDEFEEDEDDTQSQTFNSSSANTANLIGMLTSLLGSVSVTMRNLAMKGLCKLLLACRMTSSALLSRLMVMWYSPVTDGDEDFRQPMAAFLKALSTICPRGQEMLEQAFLPTLKTIRDAPADSPVSEVDMESVIKLFISLTRPGTNRFHKKQNNHVHNAFAVTLCNEILNQEDGYLDECVLLRSLLQLELCLDDSVFRQDLLNLIVSMKEAFQMRRERALYKYVEKFEKMVEETSSSELAAVPEVNNTAQTDQLNIGDNTARTDLINSVNTTAQTTQLDATAASVVKKSRKNTKVLKEGEVAVDSDDASDVSIDLAGKDRSEGTIIPESPPRPESSSGTTGSDSQDDLEEVGRQASKRLKVAASKTRRVSPTRNAGSSLEEAASKPKDGIKKGGRRVSSNEEASQASSPVTKTTTEPAEPIGRAGSRRVARLSAQAAEQARSGRRASRTDGRQDEETSLGEIQERKSRGKRRSVEQDAEPTKKKATDKRVSPAKGSPAKSKRAKGNVAKIDEVAEVVLVKISDGRPRREVKLTPRALAYKEDLNKKFPNDATPQTPKDSESAQTPDRRSDRPTSRVTNAEVSSPKTRGRKEAESSAQSSGNSSQRPAKRTRRLAIRSSSPPTPKKDKSKEKEATSSDENSSQSPAPSQSVRRDSSDVGRASRSKARPEEGLKTVRATRRSMAANKEDKTKRVAKKNVYRSSSEDNSTPERPTLRARAQSQQSSSTTDSPLPASTSSENTTMSVVKVPSKKGVVPPSSSEDSPLPTRTSSANTNKSVVKVSSKKGGFPASSSEDSPDPKSVARTDSRRLRTSGAQGPAEKDSSPTKTSLSPWRLSSQEEILQRAVERVRSGVLAQASSPPKDSPAKRISFASNQDNIIERAVDRLRRSEVFSQQSSSAVPRKLLSSSSPLSSSPSKSSRSESSQEETVKRTLRGGTTKELPAHSTATSRKTPGPTNDKTLKQTSSESSSSPKTSSSTKKGDNPKPKTSVGRMSSGSSSSLSMATRSQDFPNRLRSRKRV